MINVAASYRNNWTKVQPSPNICVCYNLRRTGVKFTNIYSGYKVKNSANPFLPLKWVVENSILFTFTIVNIMFKFAVSLETWR